MQNPVSDTQLWTPGGLHAQVSIYRIAPDKFEIYKSFGSTVPSRFIGSLGEANAIKDAFIAARLAEGYLIPEETPAMCFIA